MSFTSPSTRWMALTSRDRTADNKFVYAVKTTKIYCRPSCAARLARRANVDFYDTSAQAERAGFKPCKRCKPDAEHVHDPQGVAVAKACEIISEALHSTEYANGHIGLNDLAGQLKLTPSYLHKTFKLKMGMTPKAYAQSLRMDSGEETRDSTAQAGLGGVCEDYSSGLPGLDIGWDVANVPGPFSEADTLFSPFGLESPTASTQALQDMPVMTNELSWLHLQNSLATSGGALEGFDIWAADATWDTPKVADSTDMEMWQWNWTI